MKKISLNGISEILSEKELKNVMGGSIDGGGCNTANLRCVPEPAYPLPSCCQGLSCVYKMHPGYVTYEWRCA